MARRDTILSALFAKVSSAAAGRVPAVITPVLSILFLSVCMVKYIQLLVQPSAFRNRRLIVCLGIRWQLSLNPMKTSVFSLSVLFLLFINSIWAQGPFGQFSESQILEIIRNDRGYSDVEAYRGFSENEKSEARKFFNQYQDTLNALGKRGAFYYLRMIDLNSENRYGKIDHSAFSSRVTFWMFKDQYSPEETDQLARAKNFLSSDPNQLEARDQNAKLSAEAFL